MSTTFWLTDEISDIAGYRRLKLGSRSDGASLVRLVISTVLGPTAGVAVEEWISDPLDGTDLTAAPWQFQIWAAESAAAANAALRYQVYKYAVETGETSVLDDNPGTELGTLVRASGRTTGNATVTTMADGDRLVVKLLLDDPSVGSMAAGYGATISYNGQRARTEGDSYVICPDNVVLTAEMLPSTRTKIRRLLRDVAVTNPHLKDQEIDQYWNEALGDYNRDRPLVQEGYLSGDGSAYDFALPARWIHGFSEIREIEHPLANQQFPLLLETDDWALVGSSLGGQSVVKLRFMSMVPETGVDNIRVRYTTRHVHTDEENTIPADDLDAVACLAASYACIALAAEAAGASDPTVSADSTNHRDAEQRWRSVGKELKDRYNHRIRQAESVGAASVTRDWDTYPSVPNTDYLFHQRRWR